MKRSGLTLIEVMLALVVIGIIMAATSPMLLTSMKSNGDSRIRTQAIAATDAWLDRFRAKTLDFSYFHEGRTYNFGYDYADDNTFIAAGDPDVEALNREWQPFKYTVRTTQYSSDPVIWRVQLKTFYKKAQGTEVNFEIVTLIEQ